MESINKLVQFASFAQMLERLPDNDSCRKYLENIRWEGVPTCPRCGVSDEEAYKLSLKGVFKMYKCRNKGCQQRFTVTVGAMFEGSHIELRKWFIAIYLFSAHKKGVSSHQLAKDLGITQKSAWFMLGRIRYAFKVKTFAPMLVAPVQCDETFVGGKEKNKHQSRYAKKDKTWHQELGNYEMKKTVVAGLLDSQGTVVTKVIPGATSDALLPFIKANVNNGATVVTDEGSGYNSLYKTHTHETVNHSIGQYEYNGFHTNGIENFWSQLKRGIIGIYHHTSPEHLHRYCDEFAFRHNSRKISDSARFDLSLKNTENFRLKYKELIAKPLPL